MRTQKSISRFPLPPNSRSPTWNVTVILSSLCSCSWKHSRMWAFIWMLWADARARRALAVARNLNNIVGGGPAGRGGDRERYAVRGCGCLGRVGDATVRGSGGGMVGPTERGMVGWGRDRGLTSTLQWWMGSDITKQVPKNPYLSS
jgi:hypothetical protein